MAFSLYDATVANYLQILGTVGGFLEKSLTHFREKGIDQAEVVETRLAPDLRGFYGPTRTSADHAQVALAKGDDMMNLIHKPETAHD